MILSSKVGRNRSSAPAHHAQRRWNTGLLAIFLSAALLACPRRVAPPPVPVLHDAGELLKSVGFAEAQVFSIKGDARLKIDAPKAKGTVGLYVAVEQPARLHLETLNFFGQPQAILTSDGKVFGLLQNSEGKFYRGPATPQNVSRFLPVILPAEELAAILLGSAPRIPGDPVSLGVTPDQRAYLLGLSHGNVAQKLWIDPTSHRVLKSEVRGIDAYDLLFEDFAELTGLMLPKKVVLSAPAASTLLELNYKDVVINQTLSANLFKGDPPRDMPVIDVDEEGLPVVKGPLKRP
jgi:hypothetical protein